MNKLFTTTPDGDAVPPQAPHILFRQFTGLTSSHGSAVRVKHLFTLFHVLACLGTLNSASAHCFRACDGSGADCRIAR